MGNQPNLHQRAVRCLNMIQNGSCRYGNECTYLHPLSVRRKKKRKRHRSPSSSRSSSSSDSRRRRKKKRKRAKMIMPMQVPLMQNVPFYGPPDANTWDVSTVIRWVTSLGNDFIPYTPQF